MGHQELGAPIEVRPKRDTLGEAREDARAWKLRLPAWKRCVITVQWRVNEDKVLRIIEKARGKR